MRRYVNVMCLLGKGQKNFLTYPLKATRQPVLRRSLISTELQNITREIRELAGEQYFLQYCIRAQRNLRSACASTHVYESLRCLPDITKTRLYNFDPLNPTFISKN